MSNELIAYCGLYCGACSFKLAYDENDKEPVLLTKANFLKKKSNQDSIFLKKQYPMKITTSSYKKGYCYGYITTISWAGQVQSPT